MKTACAYIRVSTDDQVEYSPDSQIKLVRDYAKKNDYILPDEYIFKDDGISGKDAKHRPEFNRMIALAKSDEHPIDAILVWKFSRFARNQEESIVYKNLLRKKNVEVRSISEPTSEDAFGTLIERIIEWMDEYYLINLSTEVKRGMMEKVSRGEAPVRPAVGYDMINGEYVINSDSRFIRQIFNSFLAGKTKSEITRLAAAEGMKTTRGNPVDMRCIDYILHNPVYNGKIRWSKDGRAASTRDWNNENILIFDGKHEKIIDDALWNAVQARLNEQRSLYGKYQRPEQVAQFALKGLLRCSSCGATMIHSKNGFQCHQYTTRRNCTKSHYISIVKSERIVQEILAECITDMQFNFEVKTSLPQTKNDNSKLIAAEERKLQRVKEAYECGADTLDEYKENKKKILKTIEELKAKGPEQKEVDVKTYSKKVQNVLDIFRSDKSPQLKNEALRSIISYIVFDRDNSHFDVVFHL